MSDAAEHRGHTASLPEAGLPPVLFVGDHFGYPAGVSHGVTAYFLSVLPALADAGVDITACFLREPHPAADALRELGITPIFLAANRLDPLVVLRVAAIARERRCRILHAAGLKGTLAARVVARMTGARAIVHVHDRNRPGPLVGALHRAFARPSDLGVCVAHAVQDVAVESYFVHPERVRVIPNGIPLERFRDVDVGARSRVRRELAIMPESRVLAMVGRMYPVKGPQAMMRMLSAIVKRCRDVVLLFVGDGPERAACETLARELKLCGHVRFLGQRHDVPELLAACDLVVMPSESEGLPTAAIEAMAAARPVVGFDVGGMREIVEDRQNGRVIAPGDRQAFVDAVVDLLCDRAMLAAFGARASAAAERFSVAQHVRRLVACYTEAATAGADDWSMRPARGR